MTNLAEAPNVIVKVSGLDMCDPQLDDRLVAALGHDLHRVLRCRAHGLRHQLAGRTPVSLVPGCRRRLRRPSSRTSPPTSRRPCSARTPSASSGSEQRSDRGALVRGKHPRRAGAVCRQGTMCRHDLLVAWPGDRLVSERVCTPANRQLSRTARRGPCSASSMTPRSSSRTCSGASCGRTPTSWRRPTTRASLRAAGAPVPGKVGIVTGGGSGHKPAFVGYLGRNMVDAVAVGEIFSSPSAQTFLDAFQAADAGAAWPASTATTPATT